MEETLFQHASYGEAVDDARSRTLEAWRRRYAAHVRRSDLFASEIKELTICAAEASRGRLNVSTVVGARVTCKSETYMFTFRRLPGGSYVPTGDSLA